MGILWHLFLKELEAPAASTTTAAPSAPQSKPANEAPARPQPVAVEIPVSVNGARTVDGSDKRVPFSESTQTVLVFPHGAVIRIATPLSSGQLVFLTNEKTKKEVVCQVVKSKSTGSAGAYVELQFTEPSLGFWGVPLSGGAATPSVARPIAPAPSVAPKPVAPVSAAPVATKPPAATKPVSPILPATPPVKPVIAPAAPTVAPPAPVAAHTEPATPAVPQAALPVPPAPAVIEVQSATVAPPKVTVVESSVSSETPAPGIVVPAAIEQTSTPPLPPVRDYSKQIEALFTVPQASAHPEPLPAAPPATQSSTEDLKQQAARLQAQLSSLLFTETPAAPPAVTPKVEPPVAEVAKKILQISQDEPKAAPPSEPPSVVPARALASTSLGVNEEVKIPSWLAPLSQNAEAAAESTTATDGALDRAATASSENTSGDQVSQPSVVFGGQLLGESVVQGSSSGSKKGLFLGLAAAAALLTAGGWYYYQSHGAPTASAAAQPVAASTVPAATVPSSPAVSTPATSNGASSRTAEIRPPKNFVSPAAPPISEEPAPTKNSNSAAKSSQPVQVEEPPKSALGDVHLAAPVVNRSEESHGLSDATLPAIDAKTVPSSTDPFGGAAVHHNAPAAPLPIGGDVKPAELIKSVPPQYPAIARTQRVSGKVQIDALIDASGNVASAKVLSGPTLLHAAALDAVKQWKYKPAMLDGEATSMHLTVTVEFRAQ